jgi:hypothetical protein
MTITRDAWYRNPEVLFNIITTAANREIVFLSKLKHVYTVRNIYANYMDLLKKNMDRFEFFGQDYNLYYSLAKYKNIHLFSFNPVERKKQREEWNKNAIANSVSFDWGLDFDAQDLEHWQDAWLDCKKIVDDFKKYGVPYSVKWSGSKGFHIRVPASALPPLKITDDIDDYDSLFNFLKNISELLQLKYQWQKKDGFETIDLGIFDPRRIWKADYSWTCETGLIAYPLDDYQFDNFSLELVKPLSVLKTGIRNRGSLMRRGGFENLRRFLKEELGVEI